MNKNTTFLGILTGIGAGAAAMYFFDPDKGTRRRALVGNKVSKFKNRLPEAARVTGEDLSNRTRGVWHRAQDLLRRDGEADDQVIEARVRSKLGRVVSHPHAVEVRIEDGRTELSGAILASEAEDLVRHTECVRGVKSVTNNLDIYDSPEGIPMLQGGRKRAETWEFMQENWSPTARLFAGTAGTAALAYGLAKRDAVGAGLSALGGVLLARSLTNLELQRLFGYGGGRRAVDIQKAISVNVPVETAFEFWSNFENFPKFMQNVREVTVSESGRRSHWEVNGPAGIPVRWDAEITGFEPNETIAWKSLDNSGIANAGFVRFTGLDDGSTQISVHISYNPPAGAVGHTVATVFGADPKSQMDTDLMRMKSLLETGGFTELTGREGAENTPAKQEDAEHTPTAAIQPH